MPLEEKSKITEDELMFGLLLLNKYLFLKFFWKADLTIPDNRPDLPKEWVGTQRISKEQRLMMLDMSDNIELCTARKIGKTIVVEGSVLQYGVTYTGAPGGEALLVTPGDHHLAPIRRRLDTKRLDIPFFNMMVKSFNKAVGVMEFQTGLIWWMRVEGQRKRGESQVSLRAGYIIGDEMAFGGQVAYESRQQTKLPGARQLYAGVPNGVRNSPFYKIDQMSMGNTWSKHKYPSYVNPLFQSDKARNDLIESHGGENTQMYITQVLGEWGKEAYSSFPRIPVVGTLPFSYIELTEEVINVSLTNLTTLLSLPVDGIEDADAWILGGDLGFSPAPTVLLIFYLKDGLWLEFARIVMRRTNPLNQARVIDHLNIHILPEKFSVIMLDAHQWGDAILQTLHQMHLLP